MNKKEMNEATDVLGAYVAQGDNVGDGIEVPADHSWYDVVRRSDGAIICSFPAEGRHLIYRGNGIISMRPLLPDEEIFTLNGFMYSARKNLILI